MITEKLNLSSIVLSLYPYLLRKVSKNGFIITWMLHQIFMFSNKVKLAAGYNNDTTHPSALLDERTDQ